MFSLTSILPLGRGPDVDHSPAAQKRDRAASGRHEAYTPEPGEEASSEKKGPGEGGTGVRDLVEPPSPGSQNHSIQ